MNMPIYRAKKIDSDEYIIGDLIKRLRFYYIAIQDTIDSNNAYDLLTFVDKGNIFEIDPKTLAIHLPDMLDNEGNKIFASLSENGKGGDICNCTSRYQSIINEQVARYGSHKNFLPWAMEINFENKSYKDFYDDIKVIGIKE